MNKMNYGFGENQVKSTTTHFPVASDVDNVEITNCEYVSGTSQRSGNFWEGIKVTYSRKGANVTDTMFSINPDNVTPRPYIQGDTKEDAVDEKVRIYNTHLLHIASVLGYTADDLNAKCRLNGTFEQLATDYCKLILDKCQGVKLYAKTISDGGYTKISRQENSAAFLQTMDGKCELKYTPKELTMLANDTAPANGVSGARNVSTEWVSKDSI